MTTAPGAVYVTAATLLVAYAAIRGPLALAVRWHRRRTALRGIARR